MSWDYVCDENGQIEIIVSRYYNRVSRKVETFTFSGFDSFEPVSVEICGEDDSKARPVNYCNEEAKANPHVA